MSICSNYWKVRLEQTIVTFRRAIEIGDNYPARRTGWSRDGIILLERENEREREKERERHALKITISSVARPPKKKKISQVKKGPRGNEIIGRFRAPCARFAVCSHGHYLISVELRGKQWTSLPRLLVRGWHLALEHKQSCGSLGSKSQGEMSISKKFYTSQSSFFNGVSFSFFYHSKLSNESCRRTRH